MSRRRKFTQIGVVAAAISLIAGIFITTAFAANPRTNPVQYSATYVCGWATASTPLDAQLGVKPGNYATTIHIHNVTAATVSANKKVALEYSMGSALPPVIAAPAFSIARDRVLKVDCIDIWAMVGLPPGTFIKGAIHIGLSQLLPVSAIYTSQTNLAVDAPPTAGAGMSIDVEQIIPIAIGLPG